jgi:hypothetical protein
MIRILSSLAIVLVCASTVMAQGKSKDAIRKVEAVFEPAQAKPGQTVTLKIVVQLTEEYYTYPVTQLAPEAKFSANTISFPKDGPIIFVGEVVDPVEPKVKKVEDYDLLYYPGGGTWTRKAVVAPTAKAGATTTKVKLKLLICDENACFPPKTMDLEATLKVQDGPAVPVDPKYKGDVEKAGKR